MIKKGSSREGKFKHSEERKMDGEGKDRGVNKGRYGTVDIEL